MQKLLHWFSQNLMEMWHTGHRRKRHLDYYAALLPRRGPHYASHSVCPSVCLSVRSVIVTERHVAPPSELQWHTCTFRHALRAAYRTAISAVQILVIIITLANLDQFFLIVIIAEFRNEPWRKLKLKLSHPPRICCCTILRKVSVQLYSFTITAQSDEYRYLVTDSVNVHKGC